MMTSHVWVLATARDVFLLHHYDGSSLISYNISDPEASSAGTGTLLEGATAQTSMP